MPLFHLNQRVYFEDEDMKTHEGRVLGSRVDNFWPVGIDAEEEFQFLVERDDNLAIFGLKEKERPRKILRFKVGDKVMPTNKRASNTVEAKVRTISAVYLGSTNQGSYFFHDYQLDPSEANGSKQLINDDDLTWAP